MRTEQGDDLKTSDAISVDRLDQCLVRTPGTRLRSRSVAGHPWRVLRKEPRDDGKTDLVMHCPGCDRTETFEAEPVGRPHDRTGS